MTKLLSRAFAEAGKLSPKEQDAFAKWLLEELKSERRWDKLLTASADALGKLADEALAEHHSGRTMTFDPDDL